MNQDKKATWEQYVASWRAGSPAEKRALFELCLAPDCLYRDPLSEARGWDALAAYMADFHRQVPGGHFQTEQFIAHHDQSVARWRMLDAQGKSIGEGISVGNYAADGRLIGMTGFWESPEARE